MEQSDKIKKVTQEFNNLLVTLTNLRAQGQHSISFSIDCGDGGGISKARGKITIDTAVQLG